MGERLQGLDAIRRYVLVAQVRALAERAADPKVRVHYKALLRRLEP